jgi:hypothetical protein
MRVHCDISSQMELYSFHTFRGTSDAWDLEDIVKLGKKIRACPYYGTRELKNTSQVKLLEANGQQKKTYSKAGVHNFNPMAGQKYFFSIFKGQI